MSRYLLVVLFWGLLACASAQQGRSTPQAAAPMPERAKPYVEVAQKIIDRVLAKNSSWEKLLVLCDDIGHRLSGSKSLEEAIDWAAETLKKEGHENVRLEPAMVTHWVRGKESLQLHLPRPLTLPMLGLGRSVGTPAAGITTDVLVAKDEEGLRALGERVKGNIVLFNNPMPAYHPEEGSGYGHTVRFRVGGASMAAAMGAAAVLVRSVTARSLKTPHTGTLWYDEDQPKIPAAAITTEDADFLNRLFDAGKRLNVTLKMEAKEYPPIESANVIAELVGSEKPEEIVVIGGHIDSWDVGQGAHDDATGVVAAMEALTVLREMGLRPRRTIRVVLWTNEENGLGGAKAYAKAHQEEVPNHVAGIESDSGGFKPRGLGIDLQNDEDEKKVAPILAELLQVLRPIDAVEVRPGFGGADLSPLRKLGMPALGLFVEGDHYFDTHHTEADTVDKVNPDELSRCVAVMAVMAYVLADMPGRLYRPTES